MQTPEARAELSEALARLNKKFSESLPKRILALENDLAESRRTGYAAESLGKLYRTAHSLAGAAGTFGRPQLSAVAQVLAEYLNRHADGGAEFRSAEADQIDALTASVIKVANADR